MEPILSGTKLDEEITAVKRHLQALQSQKLKLGDDYISDEQERPRRVQIPQIPLAEAPAPVAGTDSGTSTSDSPLNLTLKSLKPPLQLTLSCPPTSTISELKTLLTTTHPDTAPPVDAQRWVFKGKALGDTKLLREFDSIKDGETVHLMIKPGAAMPASSSAAPSSPVPQVAVSAPPPSSTPEAPTKGHRTNPSLSMSIPKITMDSPIDPSLPSNRSSHSRSGSVSGAHSPHAGVSEAFREVVIGTELWVELKDFLADRFGPLAAGEANSRQLWEHWFTSSKDWMTASEIAKIREAAGISGMGGR